MNNYCSCMKGVHILKADVIVGLYIPKVSVKPDSMFKFWRVTLRMNVGAFLFGLCLHSFIFEG